MKQVVIIAGPHGVGKTKLIRKTSASRLFTKMPADFFNPEDYYRSLQEYYSLPTHYTPAGRAAEVPDYMERAHERAHTNRFRLLVKGRDFATEIPLSTVQDLDLLSAARNHDYHISLYFIGVNDWRVCARRLRRDQTHWHSGLSDKDIASCYHKSLSFLPGAIPYVNDGLVLDNTNARSPKKVLSIHNGRIGLIENISPPSWLIEPMSRCL